MPCRRRHRRAAIGHRRGARNRVARRCSRAHLCFAKAEPARRTGRQTGGTDAVGHTGCPHRGRIMRAPRQRQHQPATHHKRCKITDTHALDNGPGTRLFIWFGAPRWLSERRVGGRPEAGGVSSLDRGSLRRRAAQTNDRPPGRRFEVAQRQRCREVQNRQGRDDAGRAHRQ